MEMAVTTRAINCTKLQSNRHHEQANTQLFTGRMPFLSPNQQCQSIEGKSTEGKLLLMLMLLLLPTDEQKYIGK